MLEVAGVTTAQMSALSIVNAEEAITQTRLAKALGLNDSAITAMVRRLIDLEMVERVRDDTDGRALLLMNCWVKKRLPRWLQRWN